jgi:cation diffusion facilitator family transporter
MNHQKKKERVALLSVVSNTTLVVLKVAVGMVIGSVSILSEAIHSGVDLVAAVIALFSVKVSSVPADKNHPYGHGKIENMSGTVEALLIFVAALWIVYESIQKLMNPEPMDRPGWGVGVMLLSAATNLIVSRKLFQVGKETDSIALQADAWHLRTDVYTSLGVMISLGAVWAASFLFPDLEVEWVDPVAAIGVALLITKAAYDLTIQSAKDLLDVELNDEELKRIRGFILEYQEAVHGYHKLRTRKAGYFRFIDFHIKVDPAMTVLEAHKISDDLEKIIETNLQGANVTIHIEPCDGSCGPSCVEGCLLPEKHRLEMRTR